MRVLFAVLVLLLFVPVPALPSPEPIRVFAPLGDDVASIQQTLDLPRATWYNDKDDDKIFDTLEARFVTHPGPQPVIVLFRSGTDVSAAMATVQALVDVAPRHVYKHVGGFAADLTLTDVLTLAKLDAVRQIEWSQPGTPELDTSTYHMGADAVQDLLGIDGGWGDGATADDVVVAIMDTGFDGKHPDLQDKFIAFVDWTDGGKVTEPYDSANHGSHVAGIVAGRGAVDEAMKGVAPGAALVGFQISGGDTKGNAIASIDWMLDNPQYNVSISTISFGFGTTADGTDALELAHDRAFLEGILPFKSTGNSGPERGTVTIPGGARGINGVASLYDPGEGGFHISSYSSRGPTADGRIKPDFAAPGSVINSVLAGSNGYAEFSGTSMASPFAAGVAALVWAADPSLNATEVRDILRATVDDFGKEGQDIDFGYGRINALKAVQTAKLGVAEREAWDAARVAALNVTAPDNPFHAIYTLGGAGGVYDATFDVATQGMPVALTLAVNGALPDPAASARAILFTLEAPSGLAVESASTAVTSRHQQVVFTAGETGTYTMRVVNLVGGAELIIDLSANLPRDDEPSIVPEGGFQNEGTDSADEETAPGVAWIFVGVALLALARRERRPF